MKLIMKKTLSQLNKDLDIRRFGKDEYTKALDSGKKGDPWEMTILEWVRALCPPGEDAQGANLRCKEPDAILDLSNNTIVSDKKMEELCYPNSDASYMPAFTKAGIVPVPSTITFYAIGGASVPFVEANRQNRHTVTIDGTLYYYYYQNGEVQ